MIRIGDICPLFFDVLRDPFAPETGYVQKFHPSDNILLQIFSNPSETPSVVLTDFVSGKTTNVIMGTYEVNGNEMLHYKNFTGLDDSVYSVTVAGKTSEPFMVCSSDELQGRTCLIRCTHHDNNSAFDNIFWIGETQLFFDLRVEAGFKPNGYVPKVDNEQYRTQHQEGINLYALPYDTYTLTVGGAEGVPYWFARYLNRVLCLSSVEIGGKKYIRSESSVPELSQAIEGGQLFQISMSLEPQRNDVNGVMGRTEPGTASVSVGFAINNPTDGQMLQYQSEKAAFVNVTTVEV